MKNNILKSFWDYNLTDLYNKLTVKSFFIFFMIFIFLTIVLNIYRSYQVKKFKERKEEK